MNGFYVGHLGKLPLEIYSFIFEEYVKMHEVDRISYFFDGVRKMTVAPLLLGVVCSEWRTIAGPSLYVVEFYLTTARIGAYYYWRLRRRGNVSMPAAQLKFLPC